MFDSFFDPQMPFMAIDLSDRAVKIARTEGDRLLGVVRAEIPENSVIQGRIQGIDSLAEVLQKIFKSKAMRRLFLPAAAMTLPEEHCFVRGVKVPVLPQDELQQAIRWEAESAIPMSPEDAVISWKMLPRFAKAQDHVDAIVAGAPRDLAAAYADLLERAGVMTVAFEPESFAVSRALVPPDARDTVLIVDLGYHHTGVVIVQRGEVRVTANVGVVSRQLTERISKLKGISYEEAEELKKEFGIGKQGEGPELKKMLTPLLDDLVGQLTQFFQFYETHTHTDVGDSSLESQAASKEEKTKETKETEEMKEAAEAPEAVKTAPLGRAHIDRMILSGGEALLTGLPEYLGERLEVPVAVGNAFQHVRVAKDATAHPMLTTVVGLSLYTL